MTITVEVLSATISVVHFSIPNSIPISSQYIFTSCIKLTKFLRRSLVIFIIKGFQTIVFIFIVISTTFRPICPPAFFRCLLNLGTVTELRTTSFIESTGVTSSDSISHNQVQVLSIPVLLLTCNLQMTVSWEA